MTISSLAAMIGCGRDQIQNVQVEKAAPAPAMPALPPPPQPQGSDALKWTLPKGWNAEPASGMRFATLKPPAAGNVEVSVVSLSGNAGGELSNVNRWRSQLGLGPVDDQALGSLRKIVKSKAGPVSMYEFSGGGNRMIVGMLSTPGGDTWFLKLMGEDSPVSQAKGDFMKLLGTLSLG